MASTRPLPRSERLDGRSLDAPPRVDAGSQPLYTSIRAGHWLSDNFARALPNGPEQMKSVVTARLRRLQRLPQIVCGFFGDPKMAYIVAVA